MIVCSDCKHQEPLGALFCSECGAQLGSSKGLITSSFDTPPEYEEDMGGIPAPESVPMVSARLTLYFFQHEEVVRLDESGEFSVGRINEGQSILPDIDLSRFDGYKNGVSRIHASILISDKRIELKDLASANGTLLNGRKLTSLVPYPIQDGDILAFGKLQARIVIGPGAGTAPPGR